MHYQRRIKIVTYQHCYLDSGPLDFPVGKVVCIGRNYLDHIRELRNEIPEAPILFMKPAGIELQALRLCRRTGQRLFPGHHRC